MGTPSYKDHLDPNQPAYYAPRRMRDEANARLPASADTIGDASSPTSTDSLRKLAVSNRSFHTLDPIAMDEPPAARWSEFIPSVGRLAAAVGFASLAALFLVTAIPASRNQSQDSDVSGAAEAPEAAANAATTSSGMQTPHENGATATLVGFGAALAASQATQPSGPAMTHEQSEALLQQFVRWRQKLESADTSPR